MFLMLDQKGGQIVKYKWQVIKPPPDRPFTNTTEAP
jgi:hypothetical protein